MSRPFPLRVPKKPHRADDRLVPFAWCGCTTCKAIRDQREADEEAAHWTRVGELLGMEDEQEGSR